MMQSTRYAVFIVSKGKCVNIGSFLLDDNVGNYRFSFCPYSLLLCYYLSSDDMPLHHLS